MNMIGKKLSDFSVLNEAVIEEILAIAKTRPYIFFDMDGTILNSEPLHYEVVKSLCQGKKIPSMEETYGMSDGEVFPMIQEALGLNHLDEYLTKKNEALVKLIGQSDANNIRHRNIHSLLKRLKDSDIRLALVTASQYEVTHPILKHCELDCYFEKIITEREVDKTKPDPAPYLLAQDFFKAQTHECLIFEDSPTGIEAAQRAGIDHVVVKWFEGE
ncbi:HAD-IA family hydrolase [Halobacteriovorax sp. XZX-3]|uniref:HAD family hydrolase n=1 Tax=unclassified Halobacteriovorax TaxID=2639665 RepID=UPI00371BDC54